MILLVSLCLLEFSTTTNLLLVFAPLFPTLSVAKALICPLKLGEISNEILALFPLTFTVSFLISLPFSSYKLYVIDFKPLMPLLSPEISEADISTLRAELPKASTAYFPPLFETSTPLTDILFTTGATVST